MSPHEPMRVAIAPGDQSGAGESPAPDFTGVVPAGRHPIFAAIWFAATLLLILAIVMVVCSASWEYSTRRYLEGFADAVLPVNQNAQARIQAILDWMQSGPVRQTGDPSGLAPNRDPIQTLNYKSLLRVCGSATNAFLNLADVAGVPARRLLLLDSHQRAKHVVAEVRVNDRWIIVDPAFRSILLGPDGQPLTQTQLRNPAVLAEATRNISGYNKDYTYERTAHIHLARFSTVGSWLQGALDDVSPNWANSPALSLLLERESLVAVVLSVLLMLFFIAVRIALRIYAARRLGLHPVHLHARLGRAYRAFLRATG